MAGRVRVLAMTLTLLIAGGVKAVYGPCELPGGLDVISADLYDAAY